MRNKTRYALNGAKPQAKRSGIYDMMRYSLPNESIIPTTSPRDHISLRSIANLLRKLAARQASRFRQAESSTSLRMTRGDDAQDDAQDDARWDPQDDAGAMHLNIGCVQPSRDAGFPQKPNHDIITPIATVGDRI